MSDSLRVHSAIGRQMIALMMQNGASEAPFCTSPLVGACVRGRNSPYLLWCALRIWYPPPMGLIVWSRVVGLLLQEGMQRFQVGEAEALPGVWALQGCPPD